MRSVSASRAAVSDATMGRAARFSTGWFAVALALTTATQLRRGPVGPGECMLLLWLALRVAGISVQRAVFVPREARPILWFWVGAVVLLLTGWLSKVLLQLPQNGAVLYDALAFTFSAVAIIVFVLQRELAARVRLAAAGMMVALVLPLALLLAAGLAGMGSMGPLNAWYGPRFTGWSTNPNQTAFALLPMPLIGLFMLSQSRTRRQKLWWGALVVISGITGIATLSDSLILAWGVCILALLALSFYRAASLRTGGVLRQGLVRVVIPAMVFALAGAAAPGVVAKSVEAATQLSDSDQGSYRFITWMNGVQAIERSPVVGLGPGSHSGHLGPFEGFEAHNTFIDWGTNTGALGTVLYVSLLFWAGGRAFRAGSHLRLLILFSLVLFSTFHYVLRQPSFWFYLLVVAFALGARDDRAQWAGGTAIPEGARSPRAQR